MFVWWYCAIFEQRPWALNRENVSRGAMINAFNKARGMKNIVLYKRDLIC